MPDGIPPEHKIKMVVMKLWLLNAILGSLSLIARVGYLFYLSEPFVKVDPFWMSAMLLAIWIIWLIGLPIIEWLFDFSKLGSQRTVSSRDEEYRGLEVARIDPQLIVFILVLVVGVAAYCSLWYFDK